VTRQYDNHSIRPIRLAHIVFGEYFLDLLGMGYRVGCRPCSFSPFNLSGRRITLRAVPRLVAFGVVDLNTYDGLLQRRTLLRDVRADVFRKISAEFTASEVFLRFRKRRNRFTKQYSFTFAVPRKTSVCTELTKTRSQSNHVRFGYRATTVTAVRFGFRKCI